MWKNIKKVIEKIFWLNWVDKARWWIYLRNLDIHNFIKKCEDNWYKIVWIKLDEEDWKNLEFLYEIQNEEISIKLN